MSASDSNFKIFKFAAIVCLICSLVVSAAAISLRTLQQRNALNEKRINILRAAGLAENSVKLSAAEIDDKFKLITPIVINFQTGDIAEGEDPYTFDMYAAANNASKGHALKNDPANIKRIANDGSAYLLIENEKIKRVVLPIQGYGLWSTMYGFTALSLEQGAKITGITFYSHGETPGLGAEVTNPKWQAKWDGIRPYNDAGATQIQIVKRTVEGNDHQVDTISGATLTSRGVENLMNFWLGEQGYQHFIKKLISGDLSIDKLKSYKNS